MDTVGILAQVPIFPAIRRFWSPSLPPLIFPSSTVPRFAAQKIRRQSFRRVRRLQTGYVTSGPIRSLEMSHREDSLAVRALIKPSRPPRRACVPCVESPGKERFVLSLSGRHVVRACMSACLVGPVRQFASSSASGSLLAMLSLRKLTEGHRRPEPQSRHRLHTAFHPRTMNRFLLHIVAVPQGNLCPHMGVPIHQKRNTKSSWIVGRFEFEERTKRLYWGGKMTAKNEPIPMVLLTRCGLAIWPPVFCRPYNPLHLQPGKCSFLRKLRILVHGPYIPTEYSSRNDPKNTLDSFVLLFVPSMVRLARPRDAQHPSQSAYVPNGISFTACIKSMRSLSIGF